MKLLSTILHCKHLSLSMSKLTGPEVNYGLWVTTVSHRRLINCSKRSALVGTLTEGTLCCVGNLCLPLNFVMNLKLL